MGKGNTGWTAGSATSGKGNRGWMAGSVSSLSLLCVESHPPVEGRRRQRWIYIFRLERYGGWGRRAWGSKGRPALQGEGGCRP